MPKSTLEVLTAQLSVDLRRYEKGFQRAQKLTDKRLTDMEKRFDKGVDKMSKSGERMAKGFNRAIASIGVGFAIREAIQLSDVWTEATNKIKAAEVSFGGSLGSVSELNAIANDTRTALAPTVELYSRFARAAGILGRSQEDVSRSTELANKAFKAGGAAVSEQRAAILQLSQGLQSGFLAGDELRSVRENAPLIAEAIADQFGVTIGQLKQIGAEGKITSDIVFDAILNDAQKIEAQFAVTTPTISDSFTILRNKGAEFVSTMNESVGASEALSKFILVVANNLDLLADAAVVAAVAFGSAKLGLAMANFAKALRTSNALLLIAQGNLGRVAAASVLAQTATKRLSAAFLAVGGPYTLILGAVALAILSVVKATKEAARREAEWAEANRSAQNDLSDLNTALQEASRLKDESSDASDRAAKAAKLEADKYETLAETIERLNKAEKNRLVNLALLRGSEAAGRAQEIKDEIGPIEFDSDPLFDSKRTTRLRKKYEEELQLSKEFYDKARQLGQRALNDPAFAGQSGDFSKKRQAQIDELKREEEIALARARGDKAAILALEDQKLLEEKIAEYRAANFDDYEARAQAFVKSVQQARKAAEDDKPKKRTRTRKTRTKEELQADKERLDLIGRMNIARAAGNEAEVTALQEQLELARLIADYQDTGFSVESATQIATAQVEAVRNAALLREEKARALALSERELEIDLQAAAIRGDGAEVERLARIIELRERVADLKDLGLSDADAQRQADEEQRELAVATALAEKNYELERQLEFKLLLAQEAGNTAEEDRLQRELDLLRTKNDLIRGGRSAGDADRESKQQQIDLDKAHLEGQIRDTAKGAFRAAVDGNFGDYLKDKLSSAADTMFDRAIDGLLDVLLNQIDLGGLFGGGGGGIAGLFGGGGGLGGIFAGLFDSGGNIGRGQFGIVGEKGPEIVQGPASVTGRADTARLLRNRPDRNALQPAAKSAGDMVFNYNPVIDASGADPAAISRLETAMERQRQEFVPNMQKYFKEQEQGLVS